MVQEFKSGLMEQSMKELGRIIKLMGRASFGMQMGMSTKVNGKKIRLTATESIFMLTVQSMKDIGRMIYKMDSEWNHGLMAAGMKAGIKKE
jgi:hypothetical protein